MLTHGNMLSNAVMLKDYWGWGYRRAWMAGATCSSRLPIFHVHGLFVAIHGALINGSKMIWMPQVRPKAVIAAMPAPQCSWACPRCTMRMLAEAV